MCDLELFSKIWSHIWYGLVDQTDWFGSTLNIVVKRTSISKWLFTAKCYLICDRLCENRPCSHLVVLEKHLFKDFKLKLLAFAHTRPLLFSRTGFSNLLNKIQFTFEVIPCLFSDDFFKGVHQF